VQSSAWHRSRVSGSVQCSAWQYDTFRTDTRFVYTSASENRKKKRDLSESLPVSVGRACERECE
jgi:hypothetical protein